VNVGLWCVLKPTYRPRSDLGWIPLITRFLDAIRPITGQDISIDSVDDGMKHELESLRIQIDGLIQTVCVFKLGFVKDLTYTTKNSALKARLEQRTGSNQQKPNASSRGNEV
jgi:diaphanous 1